MLAARLLSKGGYDCEREVRTLEMLKIRFGDAELAACEVMLRDVAESKRLDAAIRALGPPMAAPAAAAAAASAAAGPGGGFVSSEDEELEEGEGEEGEEMMLITPTASPRAAAVAAAAAAALAPAPPPAAPQPPPPPPLPPGTGEALARLRSTIASHLFWPQLEEQQDFQLPPELHAAMEVGGAGEGGGEGGAHRRPRAPCCGALDQGGG
jgi:hypothetical protein